AGLKAADCILNRGGHRGRSLARSWLVDLPQAVVAISVAAGTGEQRPVSRLADIVVVEAVEAAHAAEMKWDWKVFVAVFAVERRLFRFEGIVVFGVETVVVIACRVRRLIHVEVEPRSVI